MTNEPTPDAGAPLFFVSYAHSKWTEQRVKIRRFFEDLSMDVAELAGRRTGDYPGFIDLSIEAGEKWGDEILTAVGTCQVFIPLVSPNLVLSDWCGKEWCAFARRTQTPSKTGKREHQTAILPVRWVAPEATSKLPRVVRAIQHFTPGRLADLEIARNYHDEGVLGLLNMGWDKEYRSVVWRLAQKVVSVTRSQVTEPSIPDARDLRNVFEEI